MLATILSVYNKWMFSADHYGFSFPLLVTTFHALVQFSLASTLRAFWPHKFKPEVRPKMSDFGYVLFTESAWFSAPPSGIPTVHVLLVQS